jgi:hypothetical protein
MSETEKAGKNGYKAFYKGRETEVWADTSYQAQQKAAAFFKARKEWQVDVYLCEREGVQVTQ